MTHPPAALAPTAKGHADAVDSPRRGPTALPKNRGSGFEEYFADPPMTPQEAAEELNEIYAEDVPFEQRIQSCIQRFRWRRRLQGDLTLFFNEYLFLGGIDTNPGAFSGQSASDLKDLTPAERRDAVATDVAPGGSAAGERFYNGDAQHWSVDFTGVAAGFFSTSLPLLTAMEPDKFTAAVGVVEIFLRYVLHHSVCPEHDADVKRALELCDAAREEWPMLTGLQAALPGQFNLAASELFCGNKQTSEDWSFYQFSRPTGFDAKAVFYSAFALMDEPDMFALLSDGQPSVSSTYECTLEVTKILPPTGNVIKRFGTLNLGADVPRMVPVGKATFKLSTIEDAWEQPVLPAPFAGDEITLYFDNAIVACLKLGMKMAVTICELNSGLRFVKAVSSLVPSFYTFLPQQMMRHFRPPQESDRPAPSVDERRDELQFARGAEAD